MQGNGRPLLDLIAQGASRGDLAEAMKRSPRASGADAATLDAQRNKALIRTCELLAQDLAAAEYAVLPPREGRGGPAVTARMERRRGKDYLLFHYRVSQTGLSLAALEFPLLGTDFVTLSLQQTPYANPLPDAPAPAQTVAPWRKHVASILRWGVVFLLFGYLIFRRNKAAKQGQPFSLRTAFLVPLGLLILFVMLIAYLYQAQWAAAKSPGTMGPQRSMAVTLQEGGDYPAIERRAREALKKSPDDLTARITLTNALMVQNKFAEARPILQVMIDREEAALYAHRQLAIIAAQANDHPAAVRHLEALLAGLGEDEGALLDLAKIQLAAKNDPEAEKTVGRALAVNPRSFGALEMRARMRLRRNDLDGAATDLRQIRHSYNTSAKYFAKDPDFSKLKGTAKYADLFAAGRPDAQ